MIRSVNKESKNLLVHKTETIPKTLDPQWSPFVLDLSRDIILGKDELQIECWDHDEDGGRDFIGRIQVPAAEFLFPGFKFPLIGPNTKAGSNAGCLIVRSAVPTGVAKAPGLHLPPAFQLKLSARRMPSIHPTPAFF